MAIERDLIEFDLEDLSPALAAIRTLTEGMWVNIEPVVEPEDLEDLRRRSPPSLVRVFSARGRPIPFATVLVDGEQLSIGLEHGRGIRVAPELADRGLDTPPRWRRQQDHARRGLVYVAPRDEPAETLLDWLMAAATTLAEVPLGTRWSALVARPRR